MTQMLEKQEDIIIQLQDERDENIAKISELNDEVTQLNSQLEHLKQHVRMMTTGTNVLDDIIEVKNKEEPKSGGFNYKALNIKQPNRNSAYAIEDCGIARKQQYDQQIVADGGTVDLTERKSIWNIQRNIRVSKSRRNLVLGSVIIVREGVISDHTFSSCMDNLRNFIKNHPRRSGSQEVLTLGS